MHRATRSRRLTRGLVAAGAASVMAGGLLVAAPGPAGASHTASVTIASGVVLTHQTFTLSGHPESVWTLSVTLDGHNKIVTTSPKRQIGTTRQNLEYLAAQEHGIAGINGDTLYFVDPTNQPRSGVMWQGHLLKAPIKGQDAILYTQTYGNANMGTVQFVGHFEAGPRKLKSINSYNSLENAKNGGITLTNNSEQSRASMKTIGNAEAQKHTPTCDQIGLRSPARGQLQVTSFTKNVHSYRQVPAGTYSFFTCATATDSSDKDYVESSLKVGQRFTAQWGMSVPNLVSMISGVRLLVYRGRAWNDSSHGGLNDLGPSMLPESFACVAAGGKHVTFGAVDGRESSAAGMTYSLLTKYLLGRKDCYDAMALSGSTDTQLVAKRPGSRSATFQNHLTDKVGNKPNGLVDGIIITRS